MKHTLKLSVMLLLVFALVFAIGMLTACGEESPEATATGTAADRGDVLASGDCKDGLKWTIYRGNGELVLSGSATEGNMYEYAKKNEVPAWKAYAGDIRGLTLDNSIKTISEETFNGLKQLVWVQFGSGVETIGVNAFRGCSNLRRIVLPASVNLIDDGAFDGCYRMYEAKLNEGLTKIGDGAFSGCRSLYTVTIPSTLKANQVASDAFLGVNKVYEILSPNSDVNGTKYGGVASNPSVTVVKDGVSKLVNKDGFVLSGNRLIAYTGSATAITTPAEAQIIAPYAFYANTQITSVVINDAASIIEENAFENCSGLTTVTIGKGAATIKENVFKNCGSLATLNYNVPTYGTSEISDLFANLSGLKNVKFDAAVVKLPTGEGLFRNCTALETVTLPATISKIPEKMFEGCTSLKTVNLGNAITEIGEGAFKNCSSLENIDLTKLKKTTSTQIGFESFYGCSSLSTIDLTNVARLQGSTFKNCTALTGVVTGTSLAFRDTKNPVFEGCVKLIDVINNTTNNYVPGADTFGGIAKYADADIGIGKGTSRLDKVNDFLFLKGASGTSYLVGYQGTAANLVFPADYKGGGYVVYNSAFENNNSITSVKLNANVTALGESAFRDCIALKSVDFNGAAVTEIGAYTFDGCYNLTTVTLTNKILSIGVCAFRDTENLGDMNISSVTTLGERAFQYSGVTNVVAGAGLEEIAYDTFSGCERLVSVQIPGVINVANQAFANCVSMRQISMPSAQTIGEYAFYRCYSLESVDISSAKTIGQCAFEACASLAGITLGEDLETISEAAFRDCGKLVYIVNKSALPLKTGEMGVGYITRNAQFVVSEADSSLKTEGDFTYIVVKESETVTKTYFVSYTGSDSKVVLPAKLGGNSYDIIRFAFYGSRVTEVVIPEGVTDIGNSAFAYSTIQKVTLPSTLRTISDSVFEGSALVEFTANTGLATIGNAAFKHCESLRTVKMTDTVKKIGDAAFRGCKILSRVDLGNGLTAISSFMFDGCANLSSLRIPASVTTVGSRWYVGCNKLVEIIDLPNKITRDKLTINGQLAYVTVKSIVKTDKASTIHTDDDGFVFYEFDANNTYLIGYVGTEKNLVLPKAYNGGTYQIYDYAFCANENIETIQISDKVTGIGAHAFDGCTSLKGLYIPTTVKGIRGVYVGEALFWGCRADLVIATGYASDADIVYNTETLPLKQNGWDTDWNLQSETSVYSVTYGVTYDLFVTMIADR